MSVSDTVSNGLGGLQRTRATETDDDRPPIATDDVFHLLQTKRRRDVLRYLREAETAVGMRELAEQVAAWEQDTSVAALSSSERQRVYISLYQSHLPKLEDAGVIEYRKNRGIVERTPRAAQLDPFLEEPTSAGMAPERRWARRYAAVAVVSGLLLVATALGAPSPGGLAVATAVVCAFSLLALVHLRSADSPLRVVEQ
ncbi:DUF7344 domain-containing protein [Natrononativus amylolyticus]|uniref:DUF7344 domain-containing protein n=1 Tax=Natrononativus amylolyticus TaxID=2963434 RepID=UPI0020CD38BB|nr:hypothetical protein [Natrononativus amylolyticus]